MKNGNVPSQNDILQVKDIDKNTLVIKTLTYSEIYEIILNQEKSDFDKEEKEEKVTIESLILWIVSLKVKKLY